MMNLLKRIILVCTLALAVSGVTQAQTSKTGRITEVASAPATCVKGDFYADTTTGLLFGCPTPPTWTQISASVGLADPGSNGVIKRTALNVTAPAAAADVVSLFSSCSGAQYLGADGACHATGTGTVTTTGAPVNGNLAKFSGATSITNGDLSGDATTAGALAVTVVKINGLTPGGTCTNQAVTSLTSSAVPGCATLTSSYVDTSIAKTGTDINTSNQVTATHLAAALPVNQGGTGTTSTLTGLVRGNASAMTAAELSGVVLSSGSNVTTPGKADVMQSSLFCQDAGASSNYACNLSPAVSAYVTGTHYLFKANTANTAPPTINFNAVGAITIKKSSGGITTDLLNNDIRAGQWVDIVYDGTNMQMQSTQGNVTETPGTPLNSLQWNSAGAFAGVTGSTVSGSKVTLANLALTLVGTLPATCTTGDFIGANRTPGIVTLVDLYICKATNTWQLVGQSVNGSAVVYADQFAGGDIGVEIAAACTFLAGAFGAGAVDAQAIAGSEAQASALANPAGCHVQLGPVHLIEAAGAIITVAQGAGLKGIGAGPPGTGFDTEITQANSANNAELINAITAGDFWHWGEIDHLRLDGNKANNTTGIGILITDTGEVSTVHHVQVVKMPGDGIKTTSASGCTGATGTVFDHINVSQNAGYGVNLNCAGQVWTIHGIGGDDNTLGMIRYNGTGTLGVYGLKAEDATGLNTPIMDILPVAGNKVGVFLANASVATNANMDIFKIETGGGDVKIGMFSSYTGSASHGCVNDLKNSMIVPASICNNVPIFTYTTDGTPGGIFSNGIQLGIQGVVGGPLLRAGSVSGTITGVVGAGDGVAGTYNWNLPNTAGAAGQVLTSQAGGTAKMTWTGGAPSVNVTPVTVAANVTTDQNLMAYTVPAGTLNSVGRTLKIHVSGVYSTPVSSVATVTEKLKLCTVSGCGSGTVLTLVNIVSGANPGTVTNNALKLDTSFTTQTAGATASFEADGLMTIDLGALSTSADSVYADTNTATVGTIDSTASLFLQYTVAFSAASASNSVTQRKMVVEIVN